VDMDEDKEKDDPLFTGDEESDDDNGLREDESEHDGHFEELEEKGDHKDVDLGKASKNTIKHEDTGDLAILGRLDNIYSMMERQATAAE